LTLIASRPKVDDFDNGTLQVLQQDILGLQVAMYQSSLVQQTQPIQKLLRKDSDECRAQASELILFDQFVQVDAQ
jgi:hypothetical protein